MKNLAGASADARQADRRPGQAGGRRSAVTNGGRPGDNLGGRRHRWTAGEPGGGRRGGGARLVLPAHEPLARRLLDLLRLPARDERVPLVHPLRPALVAALGRLANYRYLFNVDPQVWPAVKNTLWLIVVLVPLQVLFAFGIALMLARARTGVGVFRTIFYLPALAPARRRDARLRLPPQPGDGPGQHDPVASRDPGAALVPGPDLGEAVARRCSALWGVGNTMIIFLAAVLDVPRQLYESAELDGAGPLQRLR